MAVRQYIGARYVPLYDGTWNATKNYEPLTIVDDANGNSYTSRRDVPAGTALSDRTYWIQTSSFSGAIEQLRRDVTDLEAEDVAINQRADQLTNRVTKLEQPRKWFMIWDSYGTRTNAAGKTTTQILGEWGVDRFGLATGGASFAGATNFTDMLSQYVGDKSLVTDILVCGGANDNRFSYDEVLAAIGSFCTAARAQFVNARIHIAPIGVIMNDSVEANAVLKMMPRAYVAGAIKNHCMIVDNAQYILRNTLLLESDLIHPNSAGVDAIAGQIFSYINGGGVEVDYRLQATITLSEGVSYESGAVPCNMHRHNGTVTLQGTNARGFIGAITFDRAQRGKVLNPCFTLSDTLISSPQAAADDYIFAPGQVRDNQAVKWTGGFCTFKIFGKTCRMYVGANDRSDYVDGFDITETTITILD